MLSHLPAQDTNGESTRKINFKKVPMSLWYYHPSKSDTHSTVQKLIIAKTTMHKAGRTIY